MMEIVQRIRTIRKCDMIYGGGDAVSRIFNCSFGGI